MQYNICYLCKLIQRSQTDSKKKEFPACLFVCICWCMYVDMFICVLCVSACFLHLFCCPLVSPKQGKRVIITSSEYISPSFSLEQTNPHHTHLLHTSSPWQCKERPGVKCKRENAVVQTVPTTSVSCSRPPSRSCFLLWRLYLMFVSYSLSLSPSIFLLLSFLSLSQVGLLL